MKKLVFHDIMLTLKWIFWPNLYYYFIILFLFFLLIPTVAPLPARLALLIDPDNDCKSHCQGRANQSNSTHPSRRRRIVCVDAISTF